MPLNYAGGGLVMKSLVLPLLCCASALAASTPAAPTTTPATKAPTTSRGTLTRQQVEPRPPGGRLARDVVPKHQALALTVDPAQARYQGVVDIDVDVQQPHATLWLHARGLSVKKAVAKSGGASIDGVFAIVDDVEGLATLTLPRPVSGAVTLHLEFDGPFHDDLDSLYRVKAGDDWYAFTQFEPLAAREAFPCFDEPGFKIPFDVVITHPSALKAIGNTRPVKDEAAGAQTKTTFSTTKPLPTYLLAFIVGPFDVVVGGDVAPAFDRKGPLPVRAITVKGKGALVQQSVREAMKVIALEERTFGIGYPYDKLDVVAVPDFSAGAMENAGLVTFRDTLLFVDDKSPTGAQKSSLEVIAHEFAHQWFGDLVTMAWWDDLWLNEAFATWFAARAGQALRPEFNGALDLRTAANWVMGEDSLVSARQIRQPITSRGDINNAFDGITYSKGAAVIAMFEEYIDRQKGKGTFNKGVSAYLDAHRFGSGTTRDFLAAISGAAGFDIAPAFSTFLDQPGVPLVRAACSVDKKTGGPPTVTASSERFLPVGSTGDKNKKWDIPFCVSLLDKNKSTFCTILQGGAGQVALPGKGCPKLWHPNADGAGYYRFVVGAPELQALAKAQKSMSAGERLAFSSALRAGFAAATTPYAETLQAAAPLAADLEPSVALTPAGLLAFARDDVLVDEAARARVEQRAVQLYQPGLNKLGLVDRKRDTPRDRERREAFFDVVVDAKGGALAVAVAAGKELWATSTTSKLGKDLWRRALTAAVEHGNIDAARWDAWLVAAKAQPDPRMRRWMLGALSSTKDPALSQKALALVFDDALRVNELATGIWSQVGDPRTIDGAFAFVTSRYDDIARKLPEDWRPGLATAFSGYCDDDKAKAVDAFFAPKVPTTPGLDRALAQTLEEIHLCAAKKAAHKESIEETFGK
jgi:alanyl aminopeptidase